jgi:hypothetical protein
MQILKEIGIDQHDRSLIGKFCLDQGFKVWPDQRETGRVKTEKGIRQGCCLSLFSFNLYGEYLMSEAI